MALASPKIPYNTIRDALLSLFRTNYATLNTNLTGGTFLASDTSRIIAGDPRVTPVPIELFPAVMVKMESKTEDFSALGSAGRKRPVLDFGIYGIAAKVESDPDAEIMYLAANIEGILRDNIAFNSNVLYSSVGNAVFGYGDYGDGVYVHVVKIDLKCTVEVK